MKTTEAPLLVKNKQQSEEERERIRWEKMKKVASMAAPMVAVNMSQFLLQATSTMIVGHRNELSLAGIALEAHLLTSPALVSSLVFQVHWKHYVAKHLEQNNIRSSDPTLSRQWFIS